MMKPSMTGGTNWLTKKRLAAHGTILAIALWSLYVWTLVTPGLRDRNNNLKGTDFLHFYTLGALADQHDGAHLYDMDVQAALASRLVPEATGIGYLPLYPPQVSLLFAPLARLSYGWALTVWWTTCILLYGLCCYAVWRACRNLQQYGALVALLAFANPAFFNLIAWGQTSAIALAVFTTAFFLLRNRNQFLAGLVLGCLIFKPQLGLAAVVVFVAIGAWRIVGGALISATAQLSIGVFFYGMTPLRTWLQTLLQVRSLVAWLEPRPYQTHCLRTFWSMIIPWNGAASTLCIITAIAVLGGTVALWIRRDEVPLELRFSALLLATVLISPHLTVYDLVILAPAILLLADWAVSRGSELIRTCLGTLLYLVYALPLLGPLARWTHVQLSVIAMSVLLYVVWRASQAESLSREIDRTQRTAVPVR